MRKFQSLSIGGAPARGAPSEPDLHRILRHRPAQAQRRGRGGGAETGEEMTTVMAITASVVAPLVEETLKAVPLLFIFFMFRREFDGLMDGLLYGALVGFGFAMTENFFYIFGTGASSGISAEALVFFLRTIVFAQNMMG